MRTREEIERALYHLEHASLGAEMQGEGDRATATLGPLIDLLHWVLGKPSLHENVVRECEEIEKQALARRGQPPAN